MSYYKKKKVYGDSPLKEIIYELEDAVIYNSFLEERFVPYDSLKEILQRHSDTVGEFKRKIADIIS